MKFDLDQDSDEPKAACLVTPPKFNSAPLKDDGWKTTFLLGWYIFKGYIKLPGCSMFLFVINQTKRRVPCFLPSKSMEKARCLFIFCARMQVYINIRYCTIAVTKMTSPFWQCVWVWVCVCVFQTFSMIINQCQRCTLF